MMKACYAFFAVFLLLLSGCTTVKESIDYPVNIGTRPESITKAFDGDFFVTVMNEKTPGDGEVCLLYTSPSPRDLSTSRMPSSA